MSVKKEENLRKFIVVLIFSHIFDLRSNYVACASSFATCQKKVHSYGGDECFAITS